MHFPIFGSDQNRRLTAHSEVRVLHDAAGEHGRYTCVHGVAAFEVHAHAGFGGGVTSCCNGSVGTANGVARGPLELLSLCPGCGDHPRDACESEERSNV